MPHIGQRVSIVNGGAGSSCNGMEGVFLGKRGTLSIYGWVQLDGEQERRYFTMRRIRTIVEEPAVVADAVLLGPDGNGHPEDERPQEGPVNAIAMSERVSLNNLLLRVEEIQVEVGRLMNNIRKLCLDQEN